MINKIEPLPKDVFEGLIEGLEIDAINLESEGASCDAVLMAVARLKEVEAALSPAPPAPVGETPKATNDWQAGLDADMAMADTFLSQQPPSAAGEAPAVPVADAQHKTIPGYPEYDNCSPAPAVPEPIGYARRVDVTERPMSGRNSFWCSERQNVYYDTPLYTASPDLEAMRREKDALIEEIKQKHGATIIRANALEAENAALKARVEKALSGEPQFDWNNTDGQDRQTFSAHHAHWAEAAIHKVRAALQNKDQPDGTR